MQDLKSTVGGDCFDNLSGSHLQSQVNSVCQVMMSYVRFVETDWSV